MFLLLLLRHAVEMGSGKEPKSRGNPNEGIFFLMFSVFCLYFHDQKQKHPGFHEKKSKEEQTAVGAGA